MRMEYNDVKCKSCGRDWIVRSEDLARVDFLFCTYCGETYVVVCGEYNDLRKIMMEPPK